MRFKQYKKLRLKWYNKLINYVLIFLLGLVIFAIISIWMAESTLSHFEDREDIVSEELANFLIEYAEEEILSDNGSSNVNLCNSINFEDIADENTRLAMEARCAEGPVTINDLPPDLVVNQTDSFSEDMKPVLKQEYIDAIDEGREAYDSLKQKLRFFNMHYLSIMFFALLILFFINNDLIITIHYLAKKMVFLTPIFFVIPYFLFKNDFIKLIINKLDFLNILQLDFPIDPGPIVNKVLDLMAAEMVLFYSEFTTYAFIIMGVGILIWVGNNKILLPFFAKKHGYIEEDKKEETESKHSETQTKPEESKKEKIVKKETTNNKKSSKSKKVTTKKKVNKKTIKKKPSKKKAISSKK